MPSRDSVRAFGEVKAPPPAKEDLHLLQDISVSSTLTDESPAFPAWFPWALAAVLALVSISLAGLGARSRRESHEASDKLEQAQQSLAELERQYATLQDQFAALKKSQVGRISELERQLVQKAQEAEKQKNELQKKIDNAAAEVLQIKRQHPVFQNHVGSTSKSLKRGGLDPANTLPDTGLISELRIGTARATVDGPTDATATSIWDVREQRGILVFDSLIPLPADRDYQLWLFDPTTGAPISAGVFSSPEGGTARIEFRSTVAVDSAEKFGISIERKGGAPAPEGKFVIRN